VEVDIATQVKDFGFPIVAAVGMLYMIYFVWKTITEKIEKNLEEASTTLIGLIDRIRMLDNDIIRLQQKLDTAIEMRRKEDETNEEN
tara:strand:- start:4563 stop:4823 length:261 start_codon:yes stop_codon:yes gene_type:complete